MKVNFQVVASNSALTVIASANSKTVEIFEPDPLSSQNKTVSPPKTVPTLPKALQQRLQASPGKSPTVVNLDEDDKKSKPKPTKM